MTNPRTPAYWLAHLADHQLDCSVINNGIYLEDASLYPPSILTITIRDNDGKLYEIDLCIARIDAIYEMDYMEDA